MILIKETEDRQLVLFNALGEIVAQHPKQPGRYKRVIMPQHYAGLPTIPSDGPTNSPPVERRPLHIYEQYTGGVA
jgi:hypothetical protein